MLQIKGSSEEESVSHTTVEMSKDRGVKAAKLQSNAPAVVVTELNNFDVLLGRGMPILKQAGNNRFRTLIANHRDEYRAVNRHTHKDEIARRIMLTIKALGGRFLRRIDSSSDRMMYNIDENVQAWVAVDEETSLQKVKQALRELPWNAESAKKRKKSRQSIDSYSSHSGGSHGPLDTFDPMSQDLIYKKMCLENQFRLLQQQSVPTVVEPSRENFGDRDIDAIRRGSSEWSRFRRLSYPQANTAPLPSVTEEHSNVPMLPHAAARHDKARSNIGSSFYRHANPGSDRSSSKPSPDRPKYNFSLVRDNDSKPKAKGRGVQATTPESKVDP